MAVHTLEGVIEGCNLTDVFAIAPTDAPRGLKLRPHEETPDRPRFPRTPSGGLAKPGLGALTTPRNSHE